MKNEIAKNYDHKIVEEGKYAHWVAKEYFVAKNNNLPTFSMIIPPPNVTGVLHIGHAKNTTTTDIIARYKKLQGFDVLWLPGMDHAGIATQAKVEANLAKVGINKYDIGREKFLDNVWAWKDKCSTHIRSQWGKLGLSLDYTRERFTLDEMTTNAVKHVFVELYKKGLIYQGERIINWDPALQTALSNIEVEHKEIQGKFYYFKYQFADNSNEFLTIATTRPETMFGDICVVFNPKDERYLGFEGRKVINPANGEALPLIADYYVDKEFGTGAMKCTPAHDANDFEIAKRHNLDFRICLNKDATMNELAGKYCGMDRFSCREALVKDIERNGFLVKIDEITHAVGHSERSHVIVEPYLSKQWFIKMKPLAEKTIATQLSENKVEFIPARFEKILTNWMENCEDWCISRQLWWGHRIPVYYHNVTGEILVSEDEPVNSEDYHQDEDVLDTWFSSALSPFANMGWPEVTTDMERYFPLDVMVTGYDIIFFWVARMIFQSLEFTKMIPFKKVLIHGLIRDSQGRKMSKSLDNGIDPNDVIEQYGTDSLRYFLSSVGSPGLDSCYQEEKVVSSHNFLNKIWNVARFAMSYFDDDFVEKKIASKDISAIDNYVLKNLNATIESVVYNMEKYELAQATTYIYNFVYDIYCAWYLELVKVDLKDTNSESANISKQVIYQSLKAILIMLHPFVPFITEEIYLHLPVHKNSLLEESFPTPTFVTNDNNYAELLIKMITDIRLFKVNAQLQPNAKIDLEIEADEDDFKQLSRYLLRFAFAENITLVTNLEDALVYQNIKMKIVAAADEEAGKRIAKRIELLNSEIARSKGILKNQKFLEKAPANKINEEQNKLAEYIKELSSYQSK